MLGLDGRMGEGFARVEVGAEVLAFLAFWGRFWGGRDEEEGGAGGLGIVEANRASGRVGAEHGRRRRSDRESFEAIASER